MGFGSTWTEAARAALPNLAQLALGSGQRLQSDEVVTYGHAVGVHLRETDTRRTAGKYRTDKRLGGLESRHSKDLFRPDLCMV